MFAISAGPLGPALLAIGQQGGVDVGLADPAVDHVHTWGVAGRMATEEAFRRLLRGTGYVAREVRPGSYRVERQQTHPAPPSPNSPVAPLPEPDTQPIVVIASKRETTLDSYPGSAIVVPLSRGPSTVGSASFDALAAGLPMLQSTAFGSGRDKLFVRGVVDSSFVGPTQSTVGTYFGETRLVYSGANPDLKLIDVDRVEILEGPQGTLYGAGAIGGIFRIVPHVPDSQAFAADLTAGAALTEDGDPSYDISGMANLPLIRDHIAIRAVGYSSRDSGYLDNPSRDRSDINVATTSGGRLALRITPDDQWTIDVGGLIQRITARDPQYAVRDAGRLAQPASLAQPYRDTIMLGSLTATREIGDDMHVLATIGGVNRLFHLREDATRSNGPLSAYDEDSHINMITGEVRLWRTQPFGMGWLIGAAVARNQETTQRALGDPFAQRTITGVDNRALDVALFGEATQALSAAFSLTTGARISHARIDGAPLTARPLIHFFRGQGRTRFDPTFGFNLRLADGLAWFGRYGRGFRTGGLAVVAGIGRTALYSPDSIQVVETGLRFENLLHHRLSGSLAISRAWWEAIQADLIGPNGFPLTANVGNGRISALEANLIWTPIKRFSATARGLFVHSALIRPSPDFLSAKGDTLPDTPGASGTLSFSWAPPVDDTNRLRLEISGRYQGRSRLGVGPRLGFDQTGYTVADANIRLQRGPYSFLMELDNLANTRGDRFAIGNPFQIGRESQFTPLRPRTIRLTWSIAIG